MHCKKNIIRHFQHHCGISQDFTRQIYGWFGLSAILETAGRIVFRLGLTTYYIYWLIFSNNNFHGPNYLNSQNNCAKPHEFYIFLVHRDLFSALSTHQFIFFFFFYNIYIYIYIYIYSSDFGIRFGRVCWWYYNGAARISSIQILI